MFDDPHDAEDAMYNLDRTRFFGRELEIEFARGDRKSPGQMRTRDRSRRSPHSGYYDDYDRPRRRYRSYSRSPRRRSRSRTPRRRSYSRSRSRSRSHGRRRRDRTRSRTGSRSPSPIKRSPSP